MRTRVALLAFALLPCACLLTNLDGLSGAPLESDRPEAGGLDAGADVLLSLDGATTTDATADGAIEGGPAFLDEFARDSGAIGNGWLTKITPPCLAIEGGELLRSAVVVDASAQSYADCVVYRPASEDLLDVEVTAIVRFKAAPQSWPQLHARIQKATVANTGTLDSYVLFLNRSTNKIELGRSRSASSVDIYSTLVPNPPVDATTPLRFTLRVTGTSPVKLEGKIERLSGTQWLSSGQVVFDDVGAAIPVAGSVGLSAGAYTDEEPSNFAYDDFTRTAL